jgi:hypothetical protein
MSQFQSGWTNAPAVLLDKPGASSGSPAQDDKPRWKMNGVRPRGLSLDDTAIQFGFEQFERPLPTSEIQCSSDSKGTITRRYTDAAGRVFTETTSSEGRIREMKDSRGNFYSENLAGNERTREISDSNGNREIEIWHEDSWMRGLADNKGNSYFIDSNGAITRLHRDEEGTLYRESSRKNGGRTRQILDRRGNLWVERS